MPAALARSSTDPNNVLTKLSTAVEKHRFRLSQTITKTYVYEVAQHKIVGSRSGLHQSTVFPLEYNILALTLLWAEDNGKKDKNDA